MQQEIFKQVSPRVSGYNSCEINETNFIDLCKKHTRQQLAVSNSGKKMKNLICFSVLSKFSKSMQQ